MSKFGGVFLLLLIGAVLNAAFTTAAGDRAHVAGSRVAGNERLTAVNGAVLFVLFVAIAFTILYIRPLLLAHYLVGFALIPPLALKLYSTCYRLIRYYVHDRDFRAAGPPPFLLRFVDAPLLAGSTIAVMASGVELWAVGGRLGTWWLSVHTASGVVFMIAVFVHLLAHLRRSATAAAEELAGRPMQGAITRRSVLVACAILAAALAAASLTYASPFGSGFGGG